MTLTPDSDPKGEGDQGNTNPPSSTPTGVEPNLTDIDTFVAALVEHDGFTEALGRSVQSQKDRRFSKIEATQEGFAEQLAEYQKLTTGDGAVSSDVALRLMALEGGQPPVSAESPESPGKAAEGAKVNYDAVISSMGLDPKGAAVTEVLKAGGNAADKINAFTALAQTAQAAQAAQGAETPNPAGMMPAGGGTPLSADKQAQLQKEYNIELEKIPFGQVEAQSQLKKTFRDKGLPVY